MTLPNPQPHIHSYDITQPSIPTTTESPLKPKSTHTRESIHIDILHAIIFYLSNHDLAISARVSRVFYDIATPLLYRSITIDLDERVNPLWDRPKTVYSESPAQTSRSKLSAAFAKIGLGRKKEDPYGEQGDGPVRKRDFFRRNKALPTPVLEPFIAYLPSPYLSAPILPNPNPLLNRFEYTTHLTITAHRHTTCADIPPLIMPHLHSLRIRPVNHTNHLDFCHEPLYTEQYSHSPESVERLCPLIAQLRPSRLLIGDGFSGLSGSALGLTHPDTPFPPPSITEVVIFAGWSTGIEYEPEGKHFWLDKIPSTVERLTIVIQPAEAPWDMDGRWRMRRIPGFEDCFEAPLLWNRLGMALSGEAAVMEVVGVECVDREWTGISVQAEEEEIRRALGKKLGEKGRGGMEVQNTVRGLRFMSRREFDERESRRAGGI